jgi:hypothetical protein
MNYKVYRGEEIGLLVALDIFPRQRIASGHWLVQFLATLKFSCFESAVSVRPGMKRAN